jgi:bilirubin oxidase
MMHPFHVHNGQFQVLDRNGNSPPANEMGWKDTVKVGSGETVRIIKRFADFSDETNPYMYHCHILEHEDRGMMGQFLVV